MSTDTRASGRLAGFNAAVWTVGLIVAAIMAVVMMDDGAFDASGALGGGDEYRYTPWLRDEPILATDLGGGRYEGVDGAMIALSGLDPDEPVVIRPDEDSFIIDVSVTGPDGEIVTTGSYDDPPEFSYGPDRSIVVLVAQPDVELWVSGPDDETWRAEVETGGIPIADGEMSGFESASFLVDSGVSTARLTARGDGDLMIDVATVHGSDMILAAESPTEQSIAWPDAPLVHISVEAYGDAGWRLEFPPASAASPSVSPSGTPAPEESP